MCSALPKSKEWSNCEQSDRNRREYPPQMWAPFRNGRLRIPSVFNYRWNLYREGSLALCLHRDTLDRGNEPVAFTRLSFDIPRIVRIIVERRAQFLDGAIQATLEIDEDIFRPKSLL